MLRQKGGGDQAAPGDEAGEYGRGRIEQSLANRGADTICGNDDVRGFSVAIRESQGDASAAVLEPVDSRAKAQRAGCDLGEAHHHRMLQVPAMQPHIGRAVGRAKVAGYHALDDGAGAVVPVFHLGRHHRRRLQRRADVEVIEHTRGIGPERDARALIDQLLGALVHRDSKAGLGHGESGGETADATPDNRDFHGALISKRSAIMRHLCRGRDVWPAIDRGCSIA